MSEGVCSGCGKALATAETLYSAKGAPVCQACFDKADLAGSNAGGRWTLVGIGAACGALPFLVSSASYSVEMENGAVTSFSYHDVVAIAGGAACFAIAMISLLAAKKAGALRNNTLVLILVGMSCLGLLQIARGFGAFVDPKTLM